MGGKSNKKAIVAKPRPGKQKKTARSYSQGLDSAAAAYAALLLDPCGADLTYPVYAGSSGGILARCESTNTFFAGSTAVGGVFQWLPGAFSVNAGNALNQFFASDTGVGGTITFGNALTQPGAVLANNASSIRCVAACMQVYWPGTELNRQGFVTAGNTIGNSYPVGSTQTATGGNTLLSYYSRMPGDMFEIKWRPTEADQDFNGPADNLGPLNLSGHGAITLNVAGIPVSTGVRIRLVAVYEYLPSFSAGIEQSGNNKNRSKFTLDNVLSKLDSMGNWTVSAVKLASSAFQTVSRLMNPGGYIAGSAVKMLMGA